MCASENVDSSPLHATLGLAGVNSQDEVGGQVLAELVNVARVEFVSTLSDAQSDVDDVRVQNKEILCNLRGPRIGRVKGGNENRSLASRVELEMNAALREDGGFELLHSRVEREGQSVDILCGRGEETVLHDEADFELAFDDGQDLGCAGVRVRGIHPAWLEEGHCAADAVRAVTFARDEEREVLLVGNENAAAVAADGSGFEVEGELVVDVFGVGDGDKVLDVVVDGQQLLEDVDLGQIGVELFGELRGGSGVDGRRHERWEAGAGGLAAVAAAAAAAAARGRFLHHGAAGRGRPGESGEGSGVDRAGTHVEGLGLGGTSH